MANSMENGAPVFVAPTPIVDSGVYYTSPDSAYPQTYTNSQPQEPSASGKYSVLVGKTSVFCLGVALVVWGVLSQSGAAVALRFSAAQSEVAVGLWCGYMFMAAGVIAIVASHHGSRKLIIATTVSSGLAVLAAITQLAIAGVGLENDVDFYNCYRWCYPFDDDYYCACDEDDWESSAIGANGTMVFAASVALITAVWLLVVGCIAVRRKQTSFQIHSTPAQHMQQQQQLQMMPLNHPHTNTIHPPMSSQVLQMPVPYIQTMNTPMMPNQQVVQMSAPYIQTMSTSTMPSQQVLFIPIQFVQQQQQQQQQMNHPPLNTIDPATSSQLHEHHDAPRNHDAE